MRFRFRWIALALCALLCLTCLSPALADFGGFDSDGDYDDSDYDDSDYDDGDYDDSDSGGDYGGSNYGDRDYSGSNRSRSSDRGNPGIFFAVVGIMAFLVFAVRAIPRVIGRIRDKIPSLLYRRRMKKLPALKRLDPDFDLEQVREWVRSLYTRMQAEWGAGDISGVKEEFTEDCWDRFDRQLRLKTAAGHQGHVRDISFPGIDLLGWFDNGTVTILDLSLRTRIISWDTDKSGKLISGSRTDPKVMGYVWRLERPSAARSVPGVTCPHCGATTSPLLPRCQKCDGALSRGADAWRLSSIDGQRV